eukprot:PhF_6_TR42757/c0_g1_i4/m.64652
MISIDAQGFDLAVASTLSSPPSQVRSIVIECQDLPHNDQKRWLYQGAFNCDTARRCLGRPNWGDFVLDGCHNNHPKSDPWGIHFAEFNCYYRRSFVPPEESEPFHGCVKFSKYCIKRFMHRGIECPYDAVIGNTTGGENN